MLTRIRRRVSADDGVSLVEMMVAIIILGMTLFGLASSLIASLTGSRAAHNEFDASQRSQWVVEDFMRRPFDPSWVPTAYNLTTSPAVPADPAAPRGSAQYAYTTHVSWVDHPCNGSAPGDPSQGLPDARMDYLRISVTTTWTAPDQTPRTHEVVVFRHFPPSVRPTARGAAC
jgi:type II secretory pathway pseudopilin PulG